MIGIGIQKPGALMPTSPTGQSPDAVGASSDRYMRFISNQEMDAKAEAENPKIVKILPPMVSYLSKLWESAKRAKDPVQKQILADYRARKGEYDPEILAAIQQQGGSEIYMMLTALKCRALQAWIVDVMLPPDDRAWDLEATPVVDLSPDKEAALEQQIMGEAKAALSMFGELDLNAVKKRVDELRQRLRDEAKKEADEAAGRMADQIDDDLKEGNWKQAFIAALFDFVTTRACIVHGPVLRRKKVLSWEQDPQTGNFMPVERWEIKKHYERRNPLFIYPSPDSDGIDDGFLFDLQRLAPNELLAMKGTPGFRDQEIDTVMEQYALGGLRNWTSYDVEILATQNKDTSAMENADRTIDTLVYSGPIPGRLLADWGYDIEDPHEEMECRAWMVGPHVIGVRLNNAPGGKRPYGKACLEEIPGAFWGNGLAEILKDLQGMCNAAGRAISNNMGIASGPQVIINDSSRLPANESIDSMYPWKIWQFGPDKIATSHRPPMEFFQPNAMTAELIAVYDKFSGLADEFVPSYMSGNQEIHGAGSTASGLSMLMSQATKTVKNAILNLDEGVVNRCVYLTYLMEMIFNRDNSIKGDLTVIPRGAVSLLVKEQQQIRRNEFLQSTQNEYDMQIMGLPGRANVLREVAKSLDIPVDDVVPDEESIKAMAQQQQVQQLVQQEIQAIMQQLGAMLGINPNQLMQMLQQGMQQRMTGGGQPQLQGQTLDAAGNPVSGQDTRLFG